MRFYLIATAILLIATNGLHTKEAFHIIYFEPISEMTIPKSFHEPSVKSVRIDVIGTFWRATTTELNGITLIGLNESVHTVRL